MLGKGGVIFGKLKMWFGLTAPVVDGIGNGSSDKDVMPKSKVTPDWTGGILLAGGLAKSGLGFRTECALFWSTA